MKILPILLIFLLSFFAWQTLLNPGYFSMHDDQQVVRLFELNKALMAGQFPVRFVENLGFGYGYALFNFYPPLAYYVGEFFHLLGFGFIESIKLVWFTAIVGSGIAIYFFAKHLFGRMAGIVAALFYIYAPYHAVDAYIRGALAELSSFVWLPLIFLFAHKTAKDGQFKNALWTGFFLGLLMITHNLIFLPFFGITALWYGMMVLINKQNILKSIMNFGIVTITAFGLTAFFWMPALLEKQFTLVDSLLIKNLASYKIHFLCPEQLWNSPWGFGGSSAGCLDGVSFKIGKLHILSSLLALVVMLRLWRNDRKKSLIIGSSLLLLIFCSFMTTEYSTLIWDNIKELWYLQFPWRFLEFIVLFTSLLAGSLVLLTKKTLIRALIAGVLVSLLLYQNAKLFTPQTLLLNATDTVITSNENIKWNISSTSFEYMPKGVATKITNLGVVWVDIDESQIAKDKFKLRVGDFKAFKSKFDPDKFSLSGKSQKGATIEFQITNFPGWAVWIDGKKVSIQDNNKYKLITIKVPSGSHLIEGKFENTQVRSIGNLTTILFLVGFGGIMIYGIRRHSQ